MSSESLNTSFNAIHELRIFGQVISTPTLLSKELNEKLSRSAPQGVDVVVGKTLCTSDFYEEQGRMDGYFCDFTEEHRSKFIAHLHSIGVKNIEMESEAFSSLLAFLLLLSLLRLHRFLTQSLIPTVATVLEFQLASCAALW